MTIFGNYRYHNSSFCHKQQNRTLCFDFINSNIIQKHNNIKQLDIVTFLSYWAFIIPPWKKPATQRLLQHAPLQPGWIAVVRLKTASPVLVWR